MILATSYEIFQQISDFALCILRCIALLHRLLCWINCRQQFMQKLHSFFKEKVLTVFLWGNGLSTRGKLQVDVKNSNFESTLYMESVNIPVTIIDLSHALVTCIFKDTFLCVQSIVRTRTPTSYLDFTLQKGAKLKQPIASGFTAFVYVLSGKATFGTGDKEAVGNPHHTLVLSKDGDHIAVENKVSCFVSIDILIVGSIMLKTASHTTGHVQSNQ